MSGPLYQSRFIWTILSIIAVIAIASLSYRYGLNARQLTQSNHSVAYTQAILAFAHYKTNDRIESYLLRKCYEAALSETQEQKSLQLSLLSENLYATEVDPELVQYLNIRDPKLLETILARRIPVPKKSYETTCPEIQPGPR